MQVAIELDGEQVSKMVFDDLLLTRECFLEDLESENPCVFSHNAAYDKAQIIKHIEALDIILDWYRAP